MVKTDSLFRMAHKGAFWMSILALAALSSCQGKKADVSRVLERGPKIVTVALAAAWDNLNVLTSGSDYKLYPLNLIFDKPVVIRDDSSIRPKLFSSWKFSEDGLTLTATIHERANWHDGKPVTADDVVFTVGLFTSPQVTTNARFIHLTGTNDKGIALSGETPGVRAVNDKTVEFSLKKPVREIVFFSDAQILFILPKHLLGDADPASLLDHPFWQNPIGSGPFTFGSQTLGTEGHFKKNAAYHWGAPDIDEIVIRITPNNKLLPALLAGEVDLTGGTAISSLPHTDFDLAKKEPSLVTLANPYLGVQFIIVNTQYPAIRDARVRQAIERAINKRRLVDDLYAGEGTTAYSAISARNEYYNKNLRTNDYDPAKAKALLTEAGYDFNVTLRVIVPSGVTEREQSAVLIQQDLAEVGVKIKIELMEFAALNSVLLNGKDDDFAMCFMGEACTANPGSFKGYYTGNNISKIKDDTIARLYAKAEGTLDDAQAKALYYEIQQQNEDAVPFLFLYNPNQLLAYNKRLSGIDFGSHFLIDNVYEWKVE